MSGWFAASPSYRRAPLAFGLCLLAFLFAIEAKTAWYGPAAGFTAVLFRAAKAQPVASPEVVDHGLPAPDPAHPHVTFALLPQIATVMFCKVFSPAHSTKSCPASICISLLLVFHSPTCSALRRLFNFSFIGL